MSPDDVLPTRPPALIATDMDGTLLAGDGRVSARNAAVLRRAAAAGARVVIATGRPVAWLGPVIDAGFDDRAVCMNGALTYHVAEHRVESAALLPADLVQAFVAELAERVPDIAVAVERIEDGESFWAEHRYDHPWADGSYRTAERAELLSRPVAKLLVRHGHDSAALARAARSVAHRRVAITFSNDDGLIEVAAPGVSKGTALAALAAGWGIAPADAIAFGDMPNDAEMLSWAGTSVAMGNADPAIAALAGYVGPDNDADGVAAVLERWF